MSELTGDAPEREDPDDGSGVELHRFLRNLRLRWSGEAHQARVDLRLEARPDMPQALRVDLVALVRIIGNLISNAIRHAAASDGSAAVRLSVGASPDGGVEIHLADNGPGLDEKAISRLFSGGSTPENLAHMPHGLGLHIVKVLTEEQGGSFSLSNRLGGGLEAVVRFPRTLSTQQVAATFGASQPQRPDLQGMRVLLAEDNPTNQMVATQMLQALNARVTISCDGIEALERFETTEFDLLVVDIEMPRLSGLDVIRAIRGRSDQRAHVPIVALTAYALREHRERIAEAGADGLISKPITSIDALGHALLLHAARKVEEPAPVAPATEDATPVVDRAIYDALCEAIGAEIMAELLEKVVSDLGSARSELAIALSNRDWKPVCATSHILISVAGAIGATRLQAGAQTLNVAAHGDDGVAIANQVHCCLVEIDAAVEFVESRRATA
jgi:CheY-like chemotaxis protein/two-component sensor histidine kinase